GLLFVRLRGDGRAFGVVGTAMAVSSHGKGARHVSLAGHNVAGMSRAELTAKVNSIDADMRKATVRVDAPRGGFKATLEELGASVDVDKTVAHVLKVGHSGNPLGRVWSGLRSWISERPA